MSNECRGNSQGANLLAGSADNPASNTAAGEVRHGAVAGLDPELGDAAAPVSEVRLQAEPSPESDRLVDTGEESSETACEPCDLQAEPWQAALVRGLQAGESEAAAALHVRFAGRIRSLACSRGLAEAEAEEIVQETMLETWKGICDGRLRDAMALAGYVISIAKFKVGSSSRTATAREAREVEFMELAGRQLTHEVNQEIAVSMALRHELHLLSDDQKRMVALIYWDGLPAGEVGKILGITAEAVRQRKRRLLAELAKRLSGEEDGSSDDEGEAPPDEGGEE